MSLFGKTRTYTADRRQMGRTGRYSETEWTKNRTAVEPFMRDPTPRGYRLTQYSDLGKTASAQALVQKFDFAPFRRLGDIGGVPFLQARVILDHHPHLGATLTDYDAGSVAVLEKLDVFISDQPRRFSQLDLEKADFSVLEGCDVLTMWAVDYAVSDRALLELFRYIAQTGATLLLAAIHISPTGVALKNLKSLIYRTVGEARMGRRFHGWLRSDAYLGALARQAECGVKSRIRVGNYSVNVIAGQSRPT